MQLGLYRTTLAAPRLSLVFKVSFLGKMAGTGMRPGRDGNSVNLTNNEQEQPQSRSTSSAAYEEEFPPLSAASSMPQSKRRTRIDLGTPCEQSSEKDVGNIGPPKLEASTSTNHDNDTQLPTSFGKKRLPSPSRNPELHQTYGEAKRSLSSSCGAAADEPFDICLLEATDSSPLESLVNEKNGGMRVQKVQSAEENEQHNDHVEGNDDVLDSVEKNGEVLRPGMLLLKRYIPLSEQVDIVNRCRTLGCGPGGFYRPGFDNGAKMRLYMMCLGLDWNPQTKIYAKRRRHDNATPPDIPSEFSSLVGRVLDYSHTLIKGPFDTINVENVLPSMAPDVCIVNFYNTTGRLGLHQDHDESKESLVKGLPVVSISVGDSAEFLYGDQRDVDKAENVVLESGDVLIFGGESRHIFHGVKRIIPNTAPPPLLEMTKLRPGRLNLTFREY
ncbi:DNA oxidative demethylase [Handroanthus impetiginosus]|uniref:DNA oxidative demethylase n=1 Tax=Handroanthus impetiginosus TaxID=429701 RepID=A0A2G9G8J6_9LAMI|nr:DNA oxidative demethylase [Handroanthus impetiginosus]PIN15755.1 DNA oxidative demethylase [Handroanthus impetiginosus]